MSTVEVYIAAQDLIDSMIPDYATEAVERVLSLGVSKMQRYAETHHRFNSRTGTLVSAISSQVYGLSGRLYIDDFLAPYGHYVHNGQRSWSPDPFITDAFDALSGELARDIRDTVATMEVKKSADELAVMMALFLASEKDKEDDKKEIVDAIESESI